MNRLPVSFPDGDGLFTRLFGVVNEFTTTSQTSNMNAERGDRFEPAVVSDDPAVTRSTAIRDERGGRVRLGSNHD